MVAGKCQVGWRRADAAGGGQVGVARLIGAMSSFRVSNRDLYKGEGSRFGAIARSPYFENAALAVIFANAVWIAVEVDNNPEEQLINAPPVYQVVEHSFCFFFTTEWFIRFMAYRRKQDCLTDLWFIFDTFLVLLMVSETWILTIVMLLSKGVAGENLSTLTVLRLLRLLRLTRITRLMRAMPEMMFMIQGLVSAMRSVAITLFLIMIMVYVFAIAFVQLTRQHEIGAQHFRSVWPAMFTLTVEAIFPDQGWLLGELTDAGWYYGVIFFIFLVLATLTMVNMLIGILCEVACRVSAREKEIMDIEMVEAKLLQIIKESLDMNHDNRISKTEFLDIAKNDKACKALHQVGVEAADLVQHADHIFDEETEDGSYAERKLDFNEFMQVILKLRGTNAATIRDITNLRRQVKDDIYRLERVMNGGATRRGSSCSSYGGFGTSGNLVVPSSTSMRTKSSPVTCVEEDNDILLNSDFSASPSSNKVDRLQALGCEVRELNLRMGRLEELMEKVIEGQAYTQSLLKERTLPGSVKQAADGTSPLGEGPDDSFGPRLLRQMPVVEGCFATPCSSPSESRVAQPKVMTQM